LPQSEADHQVQTLPALPAQVLRQVLVVRPVRDPDLWEDLAEPDARRVLSPTSPPTAHRGDSARATEQQREERPRIQVHVSWIEIL